MKTFIIIALAMLTMSFVNIDSEPVKNAEVPQSAQNILYFYGNVDRDVTILIYERSSDNYCYDLVLNQEVNEDYLLELNPTKQYQIWFSTDNGIRKIIHVDSGMFGVFYKNFDIAYEKSTLSMLYMYQDSYDYHIQLPL